MFRGRSCTVTKSSKNPTAWSKPELSELAVKELGMKKSVADKMTKAQLCDALNAGTVPPKPAPKAKAAKAKAAPKAKTVKSKKAKAKTAKAGEVPKEKTPGQIYFENCKEMPVSQVTDIFVELFGEKKLNEMDAKYPERLHFKKEMCKKIVRQKFGKRAPKFSPAPKAKAVPKAKASPKAKKAKAAKSKTKPSPKGYHTAEDMFKSMCENSEMYMVEVEFVSLFGADSLKLLKMILAGDVLKKRLCMMIAERKFGAQSPKYKAPPPSYKAPSPKKKLSSPISPVIMGGPTLAEKKMLKETKKIISTKISKHVTGTLYGECKDLTAYFEKLWSGLSGKSEKIQNKKDLSKFKKYVMLTFHPDRNPPGKQKWASEMAQNINSYITECDKYMA